MIRHQSIFLGGMIFLLIGTLMQGEVVLAESFCRTTLFDRIPVESGETCVQYALRGGFLSWPLEERDMAAEDPTLLIAMVHFYESHEGQPYWFLIAENWLSCGIYSLEDGRQYAGWQIGDLNLDGIVNLEDLKLYSRIKEGWTGEL